jgi:DNA-binding NtrC family response regulator
VKRGKPTLGSESAEELSREPLPAAICVFAGRRALFRPALFEGGRVTLGRILDDDVEEDEQASRTHARVELLGDDSLRVHDLGSRNGTFVDGERIDDVATCRSPVIRIGHSLYLTTSDMTPLLAGVAVDEHGVVGPLLRAAHARIKRIAVDADSLLVTGETGTGKERAARTFHDAGPHNKGELVVVNCATIAHGVAERLLFGTVKGAYSGADAAAVGLIEAAHGGTLFLDEVGELDPLVQAKLLRVLETREVTPLGATRPTKVTTRFVFATMRDLKAVVDAGKFRADLYYRIARAHVDMPPLRERREEIPWLLAHVLERFAPELAMHATFVEACLLRDWSGNVRELISAAEVAARNARETGATVVRESHLPDAPASPAPPPAPAAPVSALTREAIEAALAAHDGNISATARALGLHRSQLYRRMKDLGLRS